MCVCGNWQLRATVLSRFGLPLMIDRKNPFSLTITQKHTLRFSPKIFVPTLNISQCHWILRTSLDVPKLLIFIFSLSQCNGNIQTLDLRIMSQVFYHCATRLNHSKTHSPFFTQDFCSHSKYFLVPLDSENQLHCSLYSCFIIFLSPSAVAIFEPLILGL